ncbi:SCP2 sterol-binding domain-containing protein [Thiomicrorhabdus sp. 6S2-11]|uniref:SCP2 sterol-binding domain-containing protein n=1 Tax=Thiomicrorhabdus marina TaxID=2818442 RepID=A0ABS3Q6A4_9GAMM|nr:SCP2 sterol-binding domain-containing protein [Thiomicrorhabdus marina]MBO1927801.1 SCP2 sterol-binding domain-containing protein [Thiomicrorhabdus marina]
MADLFSEEWMNQLKDAWNSEPEVKDKLAEINFSSTICCGFKGDNSPTGVFVVENGECVRAGSWNGESADWDMRADTDNWKKWMKKPLGMTSMGMAVATGKLKFNSGDFGAMIKNPSMAGPFIKSFSLMSKIG